MKIEKNSKLILLVGVFIVAICSANTLASKLFEIGPWVMTAGILAFPITFIVTDIINDVWGRKTAQWVVIVGFISNLIMVLLYQVGIWLNPAFFWEGQEAFQMILGAVPRIVGASMIAYLLSQTWDVYIFSKIKEKIPGKLWLRNNVSTFTSQAFDSAIFLGLAFGGVIPVPDLLQMYLAYIVVKWIIALIDTPLVYLGVRWVNNEN